MRGRACLLTRCIARIAKDYEANTLPFLTPLIFLVRACSWISHHSVLLRLMVMLLCAVSVYVAGHEVPRTRPCSFFSLLPSFIVLTLPWLGRCLTLSTHTLNRHSPGFTSSRFAGKGEPSPSVILHAYQGTPSIYQLLASRRASNMTTPISSASTSFSTPIDAGVRDIEAGTAPTAPPAVQAAQDQIREEEEEATRPLTIVAGSAQETGEGGKEDSEDKEKDKDRDKLVPPVLGIAGGIDRAALLGDHDDEQGSLLEEDGPDEDPIVHATRDLCLGLLRKAFYVVMPLSIVASVFACLYGWIFVNTAHYLADPDSWQRCIVYNTGNAGATPQNFAVSASAFGGMMFIFMGLGFKAGYLALQDIELLPYSLTVTCYTLLGQMVYRPVNPVVPAITELTPTLVSLASFIHPKMYTNVPNPNNNNACQHAYRVNACFLAFCCILFAANIFNLFLQIYALVRTWRVPRQERYVLVWYRPALVLVLLAIGGYILTVGAKEDAALKTLFLLEEVGHGYLFPFERPALDTVGLFLLLTVASVIYGACKQEPGSFKWAAFTAYVNVLLSYPILIR